MMNLKNHKNHGFSFVEIVIAIAIIGIILTAVFNLQNNIFNGAIAQHSRILRIFDIKNLFFDYKQNEKVLTDKNIKLNIKEPPTNLTYQISKPTNKSLSKFEGINLLKATGTWQDILRQHEEIMTTLLFIPIKKEKKAK